MNWQQPLPKTYTQMPTDEVVRRIAARKSELGGKLVILGHHYQQDHVIEFADVVGDSYQLSRDAAARPEAEYIIFCGVHFMAESADILTDNKTVILPDLGAGCSMADMAQLEDVEDAWATIHEACNGGGRDAHVTVVPITYMNSSAAIKSFVGENRGAVCTSSNCEKILAWALSKDHGLAQDPSGHWTLDTGHSSRKIMFFPDQHLGRNTAYKMGFPLESMVVWDPKLPSGGLTDDEIRAATFILWKGHCSVHQLFRPEHVDAVRKSIPGVKVIVHPECRWEVVQKADLSGSTDLIGKTIAFAPAGSAWAVGTEVHMVNRLAKKFPEKRIVMLSECQCLCTTMYRIDPPHLLWVLDELAAGRVVNRIAVDPHTKYWARVSLQRMLDITAGRPATEPTGVPPAMGTASRNLRVLSN